MTQPATEIVSTKNKRTSSEDTQRFQVRPGPKGKCSVIHDTARCWLDVVWVHANGHRPADVAAAKICRELNLQEERDEALYRRDPVAYEISLAERPLLPGQKDE